MQNNVPYKYYLSILIIIKNETPYIQEWLDYHISMGVEHFYIYDNESDDNLSEILQPYLENGFVSYTYWPGKAQQIIAYNDALEKYKHETRWLAVIDIDEFICPTEKTSLPQFLKAYEDYPGLTINWITFDSNGHIAKPHGGILENYTRIHYNYRQENLNFAVKSIVNPLKVSKLYIHNHEYVNSLMDVDENFQPVGSFWNTNVPVKKIRINHYRSKSKEEFLAKTEKGFASHVDTKRNINESDYNFENTTHDYTIWQHLKSKKHVFYRIKYQHLQNYKIISQSKFFDAPWYMEQNSELITSQDAIKHYLEIGWKMGKNPGKEFDNALYLERNKDIAQADMNPLLHYELYGKKEGREIK